MQHLRRDDYEVPTAPCVDCQRMYCQQLGILKLLRDGHITADNRKGINDVVDELCKGDTVASSLYPNEKIFGVNVLGLAQLLASFNSSTEMVIVGVWR